MKVFLLVVLIAVTACRSSNDAAILENEAVALSKYYWPKLEAVEPRLQQLYKRGQTIPETAGGFAEVGKRYQDAREAYVKLKNLVAPGPDGKSSVERQAAAAAKEDRIAALEKLIHETESELESGLTVINDDLASVESWIAEYDRVAAATPMTKKATATTEETERPAPTPTPHQTTPPTASPPTPAPAPQK